MVFVVSPNAREEDLESLKMMLENAEGGEKTNIEFKSDLFLDTIGQKAELAKDVALQASLPGGGHIIYGIDNSGKIIGVSYTGIEETISNILSNRLQFVPSGIEIIFAAVDLKDQNPASLIWIKIPKSDYEIPCAFLDKDGLWKMPVRVGTTTKYLNPVEAVQFFKSKTGSGISIEIAQSIAMETGVDFEKEIIESNLLEMKKPPKIVWAYKVGRDMTSIDLIKKYGEAPFPYQIFDDDFLCLRDRQEIEKYFTMTNKNLISYRASEFLKNKDNRKVLINLLNQELFCYAESIGLISDNERGRIFFSRDGEGIRKISWMSFSRKATRTVVGYTSYQDGSPRYWYHYGAYIKIKEIDRRLYVAISPTWVFTFDGIKPLDNEIKQKVATKKMNKEDNARILYNQHLWYQILSGNNRLFQLPLADNCGTISLEPLSCSINVGIKDDNIRMAEREMNDEEEIPEPIILGEGDGDEND